MQAAGLSNSCCCCQSEVFRPLLGPSHFVNQCQTLIQVTPPPLAPFWTSLHKKRLFKIRGPQTWYRLPHVLALKPANENSADAKPHVSKKSKPFDRPALSSSVRVGRISRGRSSSFGKGAFILGRPNINGKVGDPSSSSPKWEAEV